MIEDVRQLGTFWYMHINDRLRVLFFFYVLCLPFNVLGRAVIEVVFTVFFYNLFVVVHSFGLDLLGELLNLFFVLIAFDAVFVLL